MKLSKIAFSCLIATGITAPQFASADESLEFHGYARMGTVYEKDGNQYIEADGQTGKAVGRLGNEKDGLEIKWLKRYQVENGTKWDLGFMVEDYGTFAVKEMYAGASNVFVSQPDAYIWSGKVQHAREYNNLTDHYVTWADGKGAGVKNVDLGFAKLQLAVVDGGDGDKASNYTATSTLSHIKLTEHINLALIANYGFSDNTSDQEDAYHLVAKVSMGGHKFYYRRAENVAGAQSLSWSRQDGFTSDYFSMEGVFSPAEKIGIEYFAAYHSIEQEMQVEDGETDFATGDRVNYNTVVKSTYQWNDIHSTWLEAGYSVVDFDDSRENNEAFKVTLSQNIAVSGVTWARPMLNFYVSAGEEKNAGETTTPLIVGARMEAWW